MVENKKILAEKLKKHLNSPEYVAMPDLIKSGDSSPSLTCHGGELIIEERKFIDFVNILALCFYNN